MIEQIISAFGKAISELEERLESDESFGDSDEFREKYDTLKVQEEQISSRLQVYDESMSEKSQDKVDSLRSKFIQDQKRMKKIENQTDVDAGADGSWMADDD